jgi:hypothetical protein
LPDGLIRPVNATPPARKILLRFPQQYVCLSDHIQTDASNRQNQTAVFPGLPCNRTYCGHAKNDANDPQRTQFFIVSGLNFGGYAIGSGLPLSTT